ncbi:MAG: ABC transporter permease, partial [Oscillospiraceae bacterium]|nr:ABC transporter permease [Oscillospiraceae bacterium]
GAFLISLAAVWLGCRQLLRLTAIQLMSGKTPDKGKKKSRSSSGGSLYSRLILRNMWTDRVRVLVTIVSIAGGCVLMTVGFTLYFGISGVTDRQFGGIQTYEAEVFYDTGENENAEAEIEALLEQDGLQHIRVRKKDGVFEVDGTLDALTLIVAEKGSMDGYFDLRSIETGEKIDLSDEGVLVPRRFWEAHGEKLDGKVPVYNADMDRVEIPIVGVFENYFGQVFFLTPEGYERCFKTAAEANCFFVRTGGLSLDDLREKLEPVKGLERVRDAAADRVTIEQFSQSLTFVVVFMLFLAGMMACFIVANFTVTYIQRKTKELTIMRVNGFSSGECIRYASADLIVTTALGTLIGLAAGSWLGARILGTTETPYIQMIREPNVKTFLYSGLITVGFSAVTNSIVLQRIRRLKISDINS